MWACLAPALIPTLWHREMFNDHEETKLLRKILEFLHKVFQPHSLQISQPGADMITGVPVGGSGNFVESFVPSNSALPAGATLSVTWTVDDPNVTLAPSADGTSVVASVAATDTATSSI